MLIQKEVMSCCNWPVKCQSCGEIFDLSNDFHIDEDMREEFMQALQMKKLMGKLYCWECR